MMAARAQRFLLAFDLVPQQHAKAVFDRLVEIVLGDNQIHFDTGIMATPLLLVLTERGRSEIAYALMNQTTYPSYGYQIAQAPRHFGKTGMVTILTIMPCSVACVPGSIGRLQDQPRSRAAGIQEHLYSTIPVGRSHLRQSGIPIGSRQNCHQLDEKRGRIPIASGNPRGQYGHRALACGRSGQGERSRGAFAEGAGD